MDAAKIQKVFLMDLFSPIKSLLLLDDGYDGRNLSDADVVGSVQIATR